MKVFEEKSAAEVFNLPLFEGFLVFDLRQPDYFQQGSILSSVSFHGDDEDEDHVLQQLGDVISRAVDNGVFSRDTNVSPVVFVTDSCPATQRFSERLIRHLIQHKTKMVPAQKGEEKEEQEEEEEEESKQGQHNEKKWLKCAVNHLLRRLFNDCQEIWCVDFNSFATRFPLLVSSCHNTDFWHPTPHCAVENGPNSSVFLGSRAFNPTEQNLRGLRITHVVTHNPEMQTQLFGNAVLQQQKGLNFLVCDIPDKSDTDMQACWDTCVQFVQRAITEGGSVLVQLHGRSRSASVVLAYLMANHRIPFQKALVELRNIAPNLRLDEKLIFCEQLQVWGAKRHSALEVSTDITQ